MRNTPLVLQAAKERKVERADLRCRGNLALERLAKTLSPQCPAEKGGELRIAARVEFFTGVVVVDHDRGDGYVGDGELVSGEPVSRQRLFQVIESRRNHLV